MQKGVNVSEIESKKDVTENKIDELDKKLEELPSIKMELILQYQTEKEEQLKLKELRNFVKEKEVENVELFKILDNFYLQKNKLSDMALEEERNYEEFVSTRLRR